MLPDLVGWIGGRTELTAEALQQLLVGSDEVKRRLARQGAASVLDGASQADIMGAAGLRRVVRRADDVGELDERLVHAELAVAHRLDPPGIDAGGEARMADQVVVQ